MILSARSRDPRLARTRQHPIPTPAAHSNVQVPMPMAMPSGPIARHLPRIPKFSQSHNNLNKPLRDNDERDRDPRRRHKNESGSKSSKSSPSSKDKTKSSPSSKSHSSRSSDRKKSGSSDDSSPRKKSEEEKKSPKSSSTHHRTSHASKSPAKASNSESKDVDLRVLGGSEANMKPDSTTNPSVVNKSNKDKLLSDLLNGEDLKSSHEMITSDENGKENKSILVVTIKVRKALLWQLM